MDGGGVSESEEKRKVSAGSDHTEYIKAYIMLSARCMKKENDGWGIRGMVKNGLRTPRPSGASTQRGI